MPSPTLLHVFPGFGSGGTQLRTASIINALGHEFSHRIISLNGDLRASAAIDPAAPVEFHTGPKRSGPLSAPWTLRRTIESHKPALVLTYNWGTMDAVIGARLAGFRVIHNECGFGADEAVTLKRRRVWTRKVVLPGIYRTVVTSANMLRIARSRFGLPPEKAQLIRTGVDTQRFRPGRNPEGRARLGIGDAELLIGYAGGLRPEKNLSLLLRAFRDARIAGAKLLVVGDGPCRAALEALAAELGIARDVIFAGHTADPLPYLLMLDVFALSSSTEQVSNALLEAMACGLPVVCTDVGDSRELLGADACGCVAPPEDAAGMSKALQGVAGNPARRAALGAANRRRSVALYGRQRMLDEYAELYRSALAQAGPLA